MNNYVNIYRVEHRTLHYTNINGQIGIGPYFYTNTRAKAENLPPEFQELTEFIRVHEPRALRFNREDVLPGKTLPTSFNWVRPGPREDPMLRDWFRHTYKVRIEATEIGDMSHEPILFGFDSIEQTKRWFFHKKEFDLLKKNGFYIVKRRVPKANVVFGLAQFKSLFR